MILWIVSLTSQPLLWVAIPVWLAGNRNRSVRYLVKHLILYPTKDGSITPSRLIRSSNSICRLSDNYPQYLGLNLKWACIVSSFEVFSCKLYNLQVSHHPTISAAHAEGLNWEWWQTLVSAPKTSWSGAIEATPELPVRVRLDKEDYCWNRVSWKYRLFNFRQVKLCIFTLLIWSMVMLKQHFEVEILRQK